MGTELLEYSRQHYCGGYLEFVLSAGTKGLGTYLWRWTCEYGDGNYRHGVPGVCLGYRAENAPQEREKYTRHAGAATGSTEESTQQAIEISDSSGLRALQDQTQLRGQLW